MLTSNIITISNTTSTNNPQSITTTATTTTSEDTEVMRHRFKVVKLVSSQPYSRGRWTCFDYNDEQNQHQNTISISSKHVPAMNKMMMMTAPNCDGQIIVGCDNGALLMNNCDGQMVPVPAANQTMASQTNASTTVTSVASVVTTGVTGCTSNPATNVNSNTNTTDQTAPSSQVAIDNKIEQAMDLVKSHLMFAVREEVDVLKERIKELESDIQILMAHATPETLALLSHNRVTNATAAAAAAAAAALQQQNCPQQSQPQQQQSIINQQNVSPANHQTVNNNNPAKVAITNISSANHNGAHQPNNQD